MANFINAKDFEVIKAELRTAKLANPHPEKEEDDVYTQLNQKYCGPGTGIWYDADKDEIHLAEDWYIDDDGWVKPTSMMPGPGTI